METKTYTVTLPEELVEEILAEAGPGGLSAYVTRVIERRREQDRLGELVAWMQKEYGPLTEDEQAASAAELRDIERWFEEREAGSRGDQVAASEGAAPGGGPGQEGGGRPRGRGLRPSLLSRGGGRP